jgi:hypothetical protein
VPFFAVSIPQSIHVRALADWLFVSLQLPPAVARKRIGLLENDSAIVIREFLLEPE